MPCSRCGDVCRCVSDERQTNDSVQPHLQSDAEVGLSHLQFDAHFADPGASDSNGRPFPASPEEAGASSRPRFAVKPLPPEGFHGEEVPAEHLPARVEETAIAEEPTDMPLQPALLAETSAPAWRTEVSERLHRYRALRRPRGPRYPSLGLKFEAGTSRSTEIVVSPPSQSSVAPLAASCQAVAVDRLESGRVEARSELGRAVLEAATAQTTPRPSESRRSEATAKIIEFPRSMYAAPAPLHELADPVVDRPRILEAPDVVPPPPALGGITIEETQVSKSERHFDIDVPLQTASLDQRLLAVALDGVIVLLAAVGFGAIFYRIAGVQPPLTQIVALGGGLLGLLWAAYQYLLIVYAGTTPGLRAMKLELQRFDGSFPSRRLRRWRSLGSVLSGISLGMGYAWQVLDEDGLCWHERVTRTCLAPRTK